MVFKKWFVSIQMLEEVQIIVIKKFVEEEVFRFNLKIWRIVFRQFLIFELTFRAVC